MVILMFAELSVSELEVHYILLCCHLICFLMRYFFHSRADPIRRIYREERKMAKQEATVHEREIFSLSGPLYLTAVDW